MSKRDDPEASPDPAAGRPRLVLITGLSGSGKSTAAKALEDIDFYRVDNLPLPLLEIFLDDPAAQIGRRQRIAVVTDVRAPGFADAFPGLLRRIDRRRYATCLVFLEASDASLLQRYSETRRRHPLGGGDRPVIDGIRRERKLLVEVRRNADRVFDTTDWSVHDARREMFHAFAEEGEKGRALIVSLVSFGFKHGVPSGIDLLFDVRYLPNPYFEPELKEQTGYDAPVRAYLEGQEEYVELLRRLDEFLLYLLPRYQQENRAYLTLAVGCTGGRHRSVAVIEHLAASLAKHGWSVRLDHRDADRPG